MNHFQEILLGNKISNEDLLSSGQPKIWERETTQRVRINSTAESDPYYVEKLHPVNEHKQEGLFVLIQEVDGEFKQLKSLFRLLGDNGVGLQRSLGNGQFIPSFPDEVLTLDLPQNADTWVNFSLFRPEVNDLEKIQLEQSYYKLTKRGGWIAAPENNRLMSLRKRSVMMFTEGSTLAFSDMNDCKGRCRGKLENLEPNWKDFPHPIWRDGRAIFLPMKSQKVHND